MNFSIPFHAPVKQLESQSVLDCSDVCIVGSGIIAKSAALALSQLGLRVELICSGSENKPIQNEWDACVYTLNRLTYELLSSLRIWGAMNLERIAPILKMKIHGQASRNTGFLDFDSADHSQDVLAWVVENHNLDHALDTALRFAQGVRCMTGLADSFEYYDSHVALKFSGGEVLKAKLLIGADGGHSWVRNQLGIGMTRRLYGQRAIVCNFACEKLHRSIAHQWFTESEGIIALLPLPGERVSLIWSAPDELAKQLVEDSDRQLAEKLAPFCKDSLGQLRPLEFGCIKDFPLALMRAQTLCAPRVALIGDAAHQIHSLAGQGINLGFGDIADLCSTLQNHETGDDCGQPRLLEHYARHRKEAIFSMQLVTDGLALAYGDAPLFMRNLFNLGMNFLNCSQILKRRLIQRALGKSL